MWEMAEMSKQDHEHVDPSADSRIKEHQIVLATKRKISPPKQQSTSVASSSSRPESFERINSGPALRRIRFKL